MLGNFLLLHAHLHDHRDRHDHHRDHHLHDHRHRPHDHRDHHDHLPYEESRLLIQNN